MPGSVDACAGCGFSRSWAFARLNQPDARGVSVIYEITAALLVLTRRSTVGETRRNTHDASLLLNAHDRTLTYAQWMFAVLEAPYSTRARKKMTGGGCVNTLEYCTQRRPFRLLSWYAMTHAHIYNTIWYEHSTSSKSNNHHVKLYLKPCKCIIWVTAHWFRVAKKKNLKYHKNMARKRFFTCATSIYSNIESSSFLNCQQEMTNCAVHKQSCQLQNKAQKCRIHCNK